MITDKLIGKRVLPWATCLLLSLICANAGAQVKVTTAAGGFVNDGKPATSGALQFPQFAAMDSKGNLYIVDSVEHRIRKVATTGTISTIAGTGISGFSGDGGPAKSAMVSFPRGIVVDNSGNLFFADSANNRVRKINKSGTISTIAGNGTAGYMGDGGPATAAELNLPLGLGLDSAGNLYIADLLNNVIRKVDTGGIIHTVAGNGTPGFSGDGGSATMAQLNNPHHAIVDSAGNLYIADTLNRRVRMVNTLGTINTFAGTGQAGCAGDSGPAGAANIGAPRGLLLSGGNLLISNAGCARVRQVNLGTNIISTVVGSSLGFDGNGQTAVATKFNFPTGILLDSSGNLLIVDSGNEEVRKLTTSTQIVSGFAGGYTGDGGPGVKASLNLPENIAFDSARNMYIADSYGNRVRKLTPAGTISTFAGTGVSGYTGDGGAAMSATLFQPSGVAADKSGNVYISDSANTVIRKVDSTGKITTFATNANFGFLTSIAIDPSGNLDVADNGGCVVWQITPAAVVTIVAGVLNTCGYNADGITATTAQLNAPYGVAVDSSGHLFIGDGGNNRVREVSSGIIATVAGNGTCGYSGDGGPATMAMLCNPLGVAVDSHGVLYIGDYNNSRVRSVSSGTISTFAGTGLAGYNGDGLLATMTNLDAPVAVAVNSQNIVYVADDSQYRVRKIH